MCDCQTIRCLDGSNVHEPTCATIQLAERERVISQLEKRGYNLGDLDDECVARGWEVCLARDADSYRLIIRAVRLRLDGGRDFEELENYPFTDVTDTLVQRAVVRTRARMALTGLLPRRLNP